MHCRCMRWSIKTIVKSQCQFSSNAVAHNNYVDYQKTLDRLRLSQNGLVYPENDDASETCKNILIAALKGAETLRAKELAEALQNEISWDSNYPVHVSNYVKYSLTRYV